MLELLIYKLQDAQKTKISVDKGQGRLKKQDQKTAYLNVGLPKPLAVLQLVQVKLGVA